jgi:hypothetical protein
MEVYNADIQAAPSFKTWPIYYSSIYRLTGDISIIRQMSYLLASVVYWWELPKHFTPDAETRTTFSKTVCCCVFHFLQAALSFFLIDSLRNLHTTNLGCVRSGDHGGQRPCPAMWWPNNSCSEAVVVFVTWTGAPSCWMQQSLSVSSNREMNWGRRSWSCCASIVA